MPFTKTYDDVLAHGKTKLKVIYTNDVDAMATYVEEYKAVFQRRRQKIVGIDLEYTPNKSRAAVIQLSIGKYHPVLLFQVCAIMGERCITFDRFLGDPRYEFAGFCIDQDKEKLSRCSLHIPNFVDIQANWRVPDGTKPLDSLGDVSAAIIDDEYANMKKKMTDHDHSQWTSILSTRHVEYAAKDAYTAFEVWNRITTVQKGLACSAKEKTRKRPRSSWRVAGKGGSTSTSTSNGWNW